MVERNETVDGHSCQPSTGLYGHQRAHHHKTYSCHPLAHPPPLPLPTHPSIPEPARVHRTSVQPTRADVGAAVKVRGLLQLCQRARHGVGAAREHARRQQRRGGAAAGAGIQPQRTRVEDGHQDQVPAAALVPEVDGLWAWEWEWEWAWELWEWELWEWELWEWSTARQGREGWCVGRAVREACRLEATSHLGCSHPGKQQTLTGVALLDGGRPASSTTRDWLHVVHAHVCLLW
jgi:hypothetical protein